jgi:hypothetical protein
MPTLDDQITTLQTRLLQLKLRQQRVEARQQAIAAGRERKVDTRRKILLGAVIMNRMKDSESTRQEVLSWLDAELSRAADRNLFGLPPLPGPAPGPAPGESESAPGFEGDDGHRVGQVDAAAAVSHGKV